jgi:hypothetical protein
MKTVKFPRALSEDLRPRVGVSSNEKAIHPHAKHGDEWLFHVNRALGNKRCPG